MRISTLTSLGAAVAISLGHSGCSTFPELKTEHVVMVDGAGSLVDPRANIGEPEDGQHLLFKPYKSLERSHDYFSQLFMSLEQTPIRTGGTKKRILLYVHGGLNTAQASIKRVVEYSPKILADGSYPIFVNWDSSLISSYRDYLLNLRQGVQIESFCYFSRIHCLFTLGDLAPGLMTAPWYLSLDLSRAVLRLPLIVQRVFDGLMTSHWRNEFRTNASASSHDNCKEDAHVGMTPLADALLCEARSHTGNQTAYHFEQGVDRRTSLESAWKIARVYATFPVHVISGFVIDIAGTGSWSSMHRRTTMMFYRDSDLFSREPYRSPTGGVAEFMKNLRQFLELHGGKDEWEVTLVGHSMGTIVAIEMVRQFGNPLEKSPGKPFFDNIVFMAAACSLRDYMDTIPRYLEEYNTTRMYHLLLHDQAEVTEQAVWGTALPGSLLVWLDGFFTQPNSPLDLVAGRYENLLRVLHFHKPNLRRRISVKVFNFGAETRRTNPQTHGDFGNFPFWKEEFWNASGADPFQLPRVKEE